MFYRLTKTFFARKATQRAVPHTAADAWTALHISAMGVR